MSFTEDLSIFLSDFGVTVAAGSTEGVGILDTPGEYILDDMQVSTEYMLRAEASKFGALAYGDAVTVDGNAYTVRDNRLVDDGLFCLVMLSRVFADLLSNLLLEDGFNLLLEDGGLLLLEA